MSGTIASIGLTAGLAHADATNAGVTQLLQQANTAFGEGKLEDAASLYERVIAADRNQLDAYVKLSAIAYAKKDYATASSRADEGLAVSSGNAELKGKKGMALLALGKIPEGLKISAEAVAEGTCMFDVQLALAQQYEKAPEVDNQKKAASSYEQFLKCRPSSLSNLDDQVTVKLGLAAIKGGEYKLAVDHLLPVATKNPGNTTAQQILAAAYTGMGEFNLAIAKYQSLISLAKSQPGIYYNLGYALFKIGRYKDALSSANQYLAAKKDDKGYLLLGDVYLADRNYAQALTAFQAAEKLSPNAAGPKLRMADVYIKQKNYKQAKPILERAANTNGNDPELLRKLGEVYLELGDAAAIGMLQKVNKAQPDNADTLTLLGRAQLMGKKLGDAKQSFKAALKIDPNRVEAKQALITALNREAGAAHDANKLDDAVTALNEAIALDPAGAMSQRNLALVLMEQNKLAQAITTLQVPLKKLPNDLILNRLLARAQLGLKKTADAIATYQKAEATALAQRQEPVLAEIYAELCPLLLAGDKPNLDDIVAKLDRAMTSGTRANPDMAKVVKRNLAIALFRRGLQRMKDKNPDGVADLKRAAEDPTVLKDKEPAEFNFAYALGLLTQGSDRAANEAIGIFTKIDSKTTASFLKPPYDKLGPDFFKAYANYMQDDPVKREQAADIFRSVLGKAGSSPLAGKIKDLIRSSYELRAYEEFTRDNLKGARDDLKNAQKFASTGGQKAELEVNLATLDMDKDKSGAKKTFEAYKATTPEALVNLGILLDMEGDSKGAYDAWVEAQKHGAGGGKVKEWIEAKRKILGAK